MPAKKKKPPTTSKKAKGSAKSSPRSSPRKSPSGPSPKHSTPKTAAEVRALMREVLTADGAAAVVDLASDEVDSHVREWVSTQSLALDSALGTAGLPCGRIVEFAGKNHSGKTTASAHVIAEVQRRGGVAAMLDQDITADKAYFKAIGVKVDELDMVTSTERSFEAIVEKLEQIVDVFVASDILGVVVFDDIAAVETRHDLEAKFGAVQPGGIAKGIRSMCRRLLSKIARSRVLVLVTNQTYQAVGKVFGNPERVYGGDGFGIFASVRLMFRRKGELPAGVIGTFTEVEILKSKVSNASRQKVLLAIAWSRGFDNVYVAFELFKARELIGQSKNTMILKLSPTEEVRWVGGWQGLVKKCFDDPKVFPRLADAYRALTAPPAPMAVGAPVIDVPAKEVAPAKAEG